MKTFADGEPCPNRGCAYHTATHPCELCGRAWARGEAQVQMGMLFVKPLDERLQDGQIQKRHTDGTYS